MIPAKHYIDYQAALAEARAHGIENTSSFKERLLLLWRGAYVSTIGHEPNLICFQHRTFEYLCDVYSQLEMTGAVPFDQTISDRVIGVLGRSTRAPQKRGTKRHRLGLSEELE